MGLTDTDGLAIAMLSTILLSFGVVAMLFVCMLRNSSKRDADVDRLLEEVEAEQKAAQTAGILDAAPEVMPWERDGDWWKKESLANRPD